MKNTGTLQVTTRSDNQIVLTRVFAAPRHLVFEAMTKPELVQRWYGPRGWSLVVCEIDLKVGGAWRYVLRGPDGTDMGMRGVFREIVPPERLVYTESWGGDWPETLVTLMLAEEDGKTTSTETVLYPSRQARDAALKTGMKEGMSLSFDRLDEYLRELQSKEDER